MRAQLTAELALDGAGEGDGVLERVSGEHQVQLMVGVASVGAAEQPIAHDTTDEVEGARAGTSRP